MPAIIPAQLKLQAVELGEYFSDPDRFVIELHKLLDRYADHTYRAGMISKVEVILPSYRVPAPVIHQIVSTLSHHAESNPDPAISLIDQLWKEGYLEFRMIAVHLLGHLPSEAMDSVTELAITWAAENEERSIAMALVEHGLDRMRQEHTLAYLDLSTTWLSSDDLVEQKQGVQALEMLVRISEFENLPAIFKRMQSVVRTAHQDIVPDLLELIDALVRRSAPECTHFLLQIAREKKATPASLRLIRRSLPSFSAEDQGKLREALGRGVVD